MIRQQSHEESRLSLQCALDAGRTAAQRNRLGQFATPTVLAREMLTLAKSLLPKKGNIRFLDPAFGTGAFYSALLDVFPSQRIAEAVGFEVDSYYGNPARSLWKETLLKLYLKDFTRAPLPHDENQKFNLIICNPPYVRHHHIPAPDKTRLRCLAKQACNHTIGGLAGLYCHFICLSHAWMTDNALAGWLVPAEFMDVNYGKPIRDYLLKEVTLLRVHKFDTTDVQFSDALVSSTVVWFRKSKPNADHAFRFTTGGSLAHPTISRSVRCATLHSENKWTRFFLSGPRANTRRSVLGDFFSIKRGVATGDNKFFVMTREQIESRHLSFDCFQPILPSPRKLKENEIFADDKGWPRAEPQLFLLDCSLPENEIRSRYPELWDYLSVAAKRLSSRYLCNHRSPWYAQEKRPSSPFLCTYMGRKNNGRPSPFRFILNHSQATATNVYLLLYPMPGLASLLLKRPELKRVVWDALNAISPEGMLHEGRVYGGGLHKLEPRELANVNADTVESAIRPFLPPQHRQMTLSIGSLAL